MCEAGSVRVCTLSKQTNNPKKDTKQMEIIGSDRMFCFRLLFFFFLVFNCNCFFVVVVFSRFYSDFSSWNDEIHMVGDIIRWLHYNVALIYIEVLRDNCLISAEVIMVWDIGNDSQKPVEWKSVRRNFAGNRPAAFDQTETYNVLHISEFRARKQVIWNHKIN